jgi:hypothetical protein
MMPVVPRKMPPIRSLPMPTPFKTLTCCLAVAFAAPVLAQDNTPVPHGDVAPERRMAMQVNSKAFRMVENLLEPHMTLRLALVARQKAIAATCDGYDVDDARFSEVMAKALEKLSALTEEGQNNLPFDIALHAYFTMFGGELAIAAYDPARYCSEAEALRTELAEDAEGLVSVWKKVP